MFFGSFSICMILMASLSFHLKKKNQCVKSSTPKGYNTLGTPQGVTA